ncbi:protein adenylyltransferase SelO [Marinobacter fonticola]|uniref:protein adenylyltransferase SelO n=1 Tax=Marinobacter fonticola TaxID=2603215 RepID=UPI0011E6B71B|nr:YdiU family protein [Marinobacter fonticola]
MVTALSKFRIENRYVKLPKHFYSHVQPTPLKEPRMVCFNDELAEEMGIDPSEKDHWTRVGAGQELLEGMEPIAMKYTGHQFGMYNPDLGDGRGLLMWESYGPDGRHWDWHLKGAGMTPYSRFGDGRAVLRSTLREYLCSEAMHYLGIPTTRALFMVSAKDPVMRESIETAAALMRVAQTHIRFGHFEYAAYHKGPEAVRTLLDHTIEMHFPELLELPQAERYLRWLEEVVSRTARMVAQWQAVGFCHGVMNSDNMSIAGDTFDYGPYAFLDDFDAGYICNHTDQGGRYAYNQQPQIGFINCQFLAQTLTNVMDEDDLRRGLRRYETVYNSRFQQLMKQKLGLEQESEQDMSLIMDLFGMLHEHHIDYTLFFRGLSTRHARGNAPVRDLFVDRSVADSWLARYDERLASETRSPEERDTAMRAVNPKYILRNYLAQEAIQDAQQGIYTTVHKLLDILKRPYDEQPENERYAALPPDWGKHMEISCSS